MTGVAVGLLVAVTLGAEFVGRQSCVECHPDETDRWRGSHHDLAMQPANADTVLGDFDDATFANYGVTSTFFQRDGTYFVSTDGPEGAVREYEITHVFGVTPLQQYLVEFPGGRYQALPLCWDTRAAADGAGPPDQRSHRLDEARRGGMDCARIQDTGNIPTEPPRQSLQEAAPA